jgi:hypothetical protein
VHEWIADRMPAAPVNVMAQFHPDGCPTRRISSAGGRCQEYACAPAVHRSPWMKCSSCSIMNF